MTEEIFNGLTINDLEKLKFTLDSFGYASIRTSTILNTLGEEIGVQNPMPTDGDSIYKKDVYLQYCITTNWIDADNTGLNPAYIPFTDLHTRIVNSTTDNPKILRIHFNRTLFFNQVALGAISGNFSNVCIKILGSGGIIRTAFDDSTNNEKYTSKNYILSQQEIGNAIQLEFNTTDTVTISNINIQKILGVSLSQVERTTNSIKTISYAHAELHSGDHYFSKGYETLGNGLNKDILIVTPNTTRWAHMIIEGGGEDGAIIISLYEGVVTSNNGTRDNEKNRNRNFNDDNTTFIYYGPTVTSLGTLLYTQKIGSGKSFGGISRDAEEILLKQNTKYLLRITNGTVSNNTVNWGLDWYEHTNIENPS